VPLQKWPSNWQSRLVAWRRLAACIVGFISSIIGEPPRSVNSFELCARTFQTYCSKALKTAMLSRNIIVRIGGTPAAGYSLSVLDDGPGVASGFDPAHSKGLGMTIVLALVEQIRGTLKILPGDNGRGIKFTVYFL
jgi:hypothetical protein